MITEKGNAKKIKMFFATVMMLMLILTGRLAYLQLYRGPSLSALADGNRIRLVTISAPRGSIYDRNGRLMVTSRPAYTVSIMLLDLKNTDEVAGKLGEILNMDPQLIRDEISKRQRQRRLYQSIRIKVDIDETTHTKLEERRAELPGVVIEVETVREYTMGPYAAHLLGYVGYSDVSNEIVGKTGIERVYSDALAGVDGGKQVEVNARGTYAKVIGQVDPIPGSDIVLTIDADLQEVAVRALQESMDRTRRVTRFKNAYQGAVVAMDPKTGAVLAYVSLPAYDPNKLVVGVSPSEWKELNDPKMRPLLNRVSGATYPPGSVFKMVTAAAALEEQVVTPSERIFDTGAFRIGTTTARCWVRSGHGWVNLIRALTVSCNTYFYEMGSRLGIARIAKYAAMFGLGTKTGIDHDVDRAGTLPTADWKQERLKQPWWPGETIYAAIGQGYHAFTPLQLASYVSTIANGGTRYTPFLVQDIMGPDGKVSTEFSPVTPNPQVAEVVAVSQQNLQLIRQGMLGVAKGEGTAAWAFRNFPITVAAKTGTAQNSTGDNHGVFTAFAPYDDPQIVVVVLVEQGGAGGATGAPVAKAIFEEFFGLKNHADADGQPITDGNAPGGLE